MFKKLIIILIVFAILPILSSCLDEPVKPIKEASQEPWPEMTSEDDAIWAIVMCYNNSSIEDIMTTYEEILHSEYFFGLAPGDVGADEPAIFTRAEDIAITASMFRNQIVLELYITPSGTWFDLEEIDGGSCPGCRVTTRGYMIRAEFEQDGTMYMCEPDSYVTIIVAPDESDPSKWVIRAIYDLGS